MTPVTSPSRFLDRSPRAARRGSARDRVAPDGRKTARPAGHAGPISLFVLCLVSIGGVAPAMLPAAPAHPLEVAVQARLGYDSNPVAVGGPAAEVLGAGDTLTASGGGTLGLTLGEAPGATATFGYAGERTHFDRRSAEDYSTHRLSLTTAAGIDAWKYTLDASSLFIDGSRDTLASLSTLNANGLALWREHRRQWQHRARLQARGDYGALVLRATATALGCDYQTRVVPGRVAFADRSDVQLAGEAGWRQGAASLWLAGVRTGLQHQDVVPLPNCEFEYSNRYHRLTLGWEGRPAAGTSVTLAAGPDFRRYTGAIDPRAMLGGRDRTSLWCEAAFTAKLSPATTLSGKLARMDWLSSTGKSAYLDSAGELALTRTFSAAWSARLTGKVHRCDYFPAARDDWESLLGAGLTRKLGSRLSLTLDVLEHRGWNRLPAVAGRDFHRTVLGLGATARF